MLYRRKVKCQVCGIEEETMLDKPRPSSSEHFCSEHHLEVYAQNNLSDRARKKLKVQAGFDEKIEPELLMEEVNSPANAEFMFFLFNIKAICCTELVKGLLTKENLANTYKTLQKQPEEKKLRDFLFITDIFKMALRKEIPPANKNFVIQTVHNILKDAKIAALGNDDAPPEIEREIYTMIAKNTIDTFVDIHVAKSEAKQSGHILPMQEVLDSVKEEKGFPPAMHILTLSEVPVYKTTIELAESPLLFHRIDLMSLDPAFSDLTIQNVADTIQAESLDMVNFCIVHKSKKLGLLGEECVQVRRVAAGETLEKWAKNETYLLARNVRPKERFEPRAMVTVHFRFSTVYFGQEFDILYNIGIGQGLEVVEDRMEKTLNEMFVLGNIQSGARDMRVIGFRLPEALRTASGLETLFVGKEAESKIIQVEVTPSFISSRIELENSIYSDEELEFFGSFLTEVATPKYLDEVSDLTGLTKEEVEDELKKLFLDPSLDKLSEEKKESVMALRCCRLLLQVDEARNLDGLHRHSHLFPNLTRSLNLMLGCARGLIDSSAIIKFKNGLDQPVNPRSSLVLT